MRLIGTLPGEAAAKRFCDFLVTQRVDCHIEPGADDSAWQIWIEHDDAVDHGRAELDRYRVNPSDARYDAANEAEKLRRAQVQAAARRQKNYRDVRTTMFATAGGAGNAPVTAVLVGICVLVSLLTHFGDFDSPLLQRMLFQMPQVTQAQPGEDGETPEPVIVSSGAFENIRHGEAWRLITPIFLHFGILHLVFDVMFLWQFGSAIERVRGSGLMILLVLLTALIGNTAQGVWMSWQTPHGLALFGGISGVDAGLFGYVWMCGKFRPYEGLGVSQYNVGLLLGWLVLCSTGFVGPIANAAHWGGLLVGAAIGIAPTLAKRVGR